MRVKRLDQEEQYILQQHTVTMEQICQEFDISMNTARRDMEVLIQKGTVNKVYGGVTAVEPTTDGELLAFTVRNAKHRDLKNILGAKAATFVEENDTIFLDTGTTTLHIIDHVKHMPVTIITNSVQVLYKALPYSNLRVIALPGTLKRDTASLVGSTCVEHLRNYNISKCFMACTSISLDKGICNASYEEQEIKRLALQRSVEHFLLVDSTKFGKTSLMTYCQIEEMETLITDQKPAPEYEEYCREHDVKIVLA